MQDVLTYYHAHSYLVVCLLFGPSSKVWLADKENGLVCLILNSKLKTMLSSTINSLFVLLLYAIAFCTLQTLTVLVSNTLLT